MKPLLLIALTTIGLFAQDKLAPMSFLEKEAPELLEDFRWLKKNDPSGYRSSLEDATVAAHEYSHLLKIGEKKTASAYLKMYKIDFEAIGIADEIVTSTDEGERKQLKSSLRKLVAASYEQWVIVERARITRLEQEVARLRKDFESTIQDKAAVIDADVQSLIQESRDFRKSNRGE
ncbi:MAG: hypothetical protein AAGD22_18105 [Verrucomicrobiota bacterium]